MGVLSGKSTELFMIHIYVASVGGGGGGGGRHKYPSTLQAGVHLKKGQKLIVKFGGGSLVLSPLHTVLASSKVGK